MPHPASRAARARRAGTLLAAASVAASVALSGCSADAHEARAISQTITSPAPSATPTSSAAAGYRYEDTAVGYGISFPDEPVVGPLSGSDGAMKAEYSTLPDPTDPDAVFYTVGATASSPAAIDRDQLESNLSHLVVSGGSLSPPKDIDLDGVPGLVSEVTGLFDKKATVVLAGSGHTYYQLMVVGGTAEQSQKFIDSFELLDD